MDIRALEGFCRRHWEEEVLPALIDYIRIPCKSPLFDPQWAAHGHMDEAVSRCAAWARRQQIPGLSLEVVRLPGRTPLIFIDIPGRGEDTVLLYGHLDKQPEMSGWRAGLGPWEPVLEEGRLYGRGGADDGYALFSCLTALAGLAGQGIPHSRCVVLIETSEESGSPDLPPYMEHLAARIGRPALVICLDSCCGNYEQLWCTTSLRGMVGGRLCVEILDEGVHSGDAGGVVPCSFRILRQLLARLEDEEDGRITLPECHVSVPARRLEQARQAAAALGEMLWRRFPFVAGAEPLTGDAVELILNRTWRPTLAITGADHFPAITDAGNVLRPASAVKLSLRLPPTAPAAAVAAKVKLLLESAPPHKAGVRFALDCAADGWHAADTAPWLDAAMQQASQDFFGKPAAYMGEGVSIPFMSMLGQSFPAAQFLVTGLLGPGSNAHGPNEFLHLDAARKLTCCIAAVIAGQAARAPTST